MRGTQLARQWKIIRLLEARKRGLTVSQMKGELNTPTRTIYRDLEALQEAGFPIYTERIDKYAYWKIMDGSKSKFPLPLTVTELMSLHMSRDLLRIFEGTVFHESIETLFSKVKASLPAETTRFLDNISGRIKVGFGPAKSYPELKKIISEIGKATAGRKRVEIRYKAASTGKETRRVVDPYQVWAMNGSFYLIGNFHLRNGVRTFAMDRIRSFSVTDETFVLPKDFSLEDYLQSAFRVMRGKPEKVKVRFHPGAANVVRERIWHPTQEIRKQPDGGLIITLAVPINYEIISWILGFGSAAEVLEPKSLRTTIADELQASAKIYGRRESPPLPKSLEKKVVPRLS